MEIIDELEPTKRGPYAGRGRLPRLLRQPRHRHRDPHDGVARRASERAGGSRDRGRLGGRRRRPGMPEQGEGVAHCRWPPLASWSRWNREPARRVRPEPVGAGGRVGPGCHLVPPEPSSRRTSIPSTTARPLPRCSWPRRASSRSPSGRPVGREQMAGPNGGSTPIPRSAPHLADGARSLQDPGQGRDRGSNGRATGLASVVIGAVADAMAVPDARCAGDHARSGAWPRASTCSGRIDACRPGSPRLDARADRPRSSRRCGSRPACRASGSTSTSRTIPQEAFLERRRGVVHQGLLPRPGARVPHRLARPRQPVPAPPVVRRTLRSPPAEAEVVVDDKVVGRSRARPRCPTKTASSRWPWSAARSNRPTEVTIRWRRRTKSRPSVLA